MNSKAALSQEQIMIAIIVVVVVIVVISFVVNLDILGILKAIIPGFEQGSDQKVDVEIDEGTEQVEVPILAFGEDLEARKKLIPFGVDILKPCKLPTDVKIGDCVDMTGISDKEITALLDIRQSYQGKMEIISYNFETKDIGLLTDEAFSFYLLKSIEISESNVKIGDVYNVRGNAFIVKNIIQGNGGIKIIWEVKLQT